MADEQLGRLLLIRRNTLQDGTGTDQNVCGLQDRSFSMATNKVERIKADCDNPEQALVKTVSPGVQTLQFTGTAIFEANARMKAVLDDARLQRSWSYTVVWPGYGSWTGPFLVDVTGNGPLEGDLTAQMTWDPTETPTWVAES